MGEDPFLLSNKVDVDNRRYPHKFKVKVRYN